MAMQGVSFVDTVDGRKVASGSAARVEMGNPDLGPFKVGVLRTATLEDVRVDLFADHIPEVEWADGAVPARAHAIRLETGPQRGRQVRLAREEGLLQQAVVRLRDRLVQDTFGGREVVSAVLTGLRARVFVAGNIWASLTCRRATVSGRKSALECHDAVLTSRDRAEEIRAPLARFIPARGNAPAR